LLLGFKDGILTQIAHGASFFGDFAAQLERGDTGKKNSFWPKPTLRGIFLIPAKRTLFYWTFLLDASYLIRLNYYSEKSNYDNPDVLRRCRVQPSSISQEHTPKRWRTRHSNHS
jgi:hypothetical protein